MLFNKARAIEYMRRYELDVLVASSPANITYFSDYYCWADMLMKEYMLAPGGSSNLHQGYAVFPLEGDPALVINHSVFAVNAVDSWVRDLYTFGDSPLDESLPGGTMSSRGRRLLDMHRSRRRGATPKDALLSILNDRGLADARIGLQTESLPSNAKEAISRALPRASIKDCTNLIRLIRMVKTGEEIARLGRAAEISEQAGLESLSLARPGRPVADLVQSYRARVAESGADFDHFIYGFEGLGIAGESDYVLREDDILYVDFGCTYQYYFSDTGITLAMREPSAELFRRHTAIHDGFDAALVVMRPGVKSSVVRDAMWDTMKAGGIAVSFPHGHGLGLEIRDYPILVADNSLRIRDDCVDVPSNLPLEADMVINLEAAVFMPGVGSLQIEKSFVVTPDSSRPLVPQDRARPLIPNIAAV